MRVAVAGGTGVVGRHVVAALDAAGHEPVVLARAHGVDLVTGAGLDAALDGVDAVVDVSNVSTLSRRRSVAFFTAVTRNLLAARVPHVALSIVGVDRVASGYYEGKRRQEALVLADSEPGTVLRATQFHEFAGQVLERAPGPLAVVPRMRVQPIAAREVGAALAELAVGPPRGLLPELAGPQEHDLVDLARRVTTRRVVSVRLPGAAGRAMAEGGLLPAERGDRGGQTFEEWLDER